MISTPSHRAHSIPPTHQSEYTGSTRASNVNSTRKTRQDKRDERVRFLFNLVRYVGEVSPRQEAATKTRALSWTAPEAREGKGTRPVRKQTTSAAQATRKSSWPSSKWKQLYNQPAATCQGGWEGKVSGAPGLSRALNPKWHQINDFHTNQQARENFHST